MCRCKIWKKKVKVLKLFDDKKRNLKEMIRADDKISKSHSNFQRLYSQRKFCIYLMTEVSLAIPIFVPIEQSKIASQLWK